MKVTILLATYNRAHLIEETLRSIQNQTHVNFEWFITDDNSTDNTKDVVRTFCEKDNRFQYFLKPRKYPQGLSATRNFGLDLTEEREAAYIQFFDDDDIMHPQKLELQILSLNRNPKSKFSICGWSNFIKYEQIDWEQIWEIRPNKRFSIGESYFDGSNFETKAVLKKMESKIDKIIVQENNGASAARNAGTRAAMGEYILVLDSDDYFQKSFCEKAIKILSESVEVKLVTSYINRFLEKGKTELIKPKEATIVDFLKYNCATGSAFFRKNDFIQCGGYDEKMNIGYEDWEFYIRLLKDGGVSYVIPEILFYYRQKKESNSTRANKIKYDLLKYIYMKHKDLYTLYYEDFVSHLLERLEIVEKAEQKNLNKIEFKLGEFILFPARKFKRLFK